MAPSWPRGRSSRAQCRMTRKPTLRRRCGQTRTLRRRARCAPAGSRRSRRASVLVELVHHVTVGVEGEPATVTELGRDIQTSARHAASTASLDSRLRRRRGCGATGGAEGDLVASQLLRASRETRGERRHSRPPRLPGPDRTEDRLQIDPCVPRRVRRRHQQNSRQPPLQRADPRLPRVQIGRKGASKTSRTWRPATIRSGANTCRFRSSPLAARWSTATKPLTETRSWASKPGSCLSLARGGGLLSERAPSTSRRHSRRSSSWWKSK